MSYNSRLSRIDLNSQKVFNGTCNLLINVYKSLILIKNLMEHVTIHELTLFYNTLSGQILLFTFILTLVKIESYIK